MTRVSSARGAKKSAGTAGNAAGNGSYTFPVRSEGQRLLLEVEDSFAVIGRAASVGSKATVSRWRGGERKPEDAQRRHLKKAYGIPVESWDQPPTIAQAAESAPAAEEHAVSAEAPANSAAHFWELMRDIRAIKRNLSPSEQLKATKDEGALRSLYERSLDKVARDWDRMIRESPQWKRFEDTLVHALEKFPEAKAAVLEVLEKLGP